jgi:hypothetical protein
MWQQAQNGTGVAASLVVDATYPIIEECAVLMQTLLSPRYHIG